MAISFVGSGTATTTSAGSLTYNFSSLVDAGGATPTLQAGDWVYIVEVKGHNGSSTMAAPTGYTSALAALVNGNDTNDVAGQVYRKKMGATPDSSVTLPAAPAAGQSFSFVIMAFRGVDGTTPEDVASVTASGINGSNADPPAITPVTAGAWILCFGGMAGSSSATWAAAMTNPAGMSAVANHFRTVQETTQTQCSAAAVALKTDWSSGAFDCGAFSSANTNAANAWVAGAIALRPAATGVPVGVASETDTGTGLGIGIATALGSASNSALALSPLLIGTAGIATQADAAITLTARLIAPPLVAAEANAALPLGVAMPVGRAAESCTASGLAAALIAGVKVAGEAETALALPLGGVAIAVSPAVESDSAIRRGAALGIGSAGTADYGGALSPALRFAAAGESGTAFAFPAILIGGVGIADEIGEALALASPQAAARAYPLAGRVQPYPGSPPSYPLGGDGQPYPGSAAQTYPLAGTMQQYPLAS